ncbi:hypothetical protein D3C86_2159870 [compost metagenome]
MTWTGLPTELLTASISEAMTSSVAASSSDPPVGSMVAWYVVNVHCRLLFR